MVVFGRESFRPLVVLARVVLGYHDLPDRAGTDRNGPERTGTDRNGPERTGADSETDCFKSSFIYLISHNDRSGSKRTGTDSKIAKLVVAMPVFIIYIFLKTETDWNGLKNCKTCCFKASFYHQHNHNDRNVQKIAKQQTCAVSNTMF